MVPRWFLLPLALAATALTGCDDEPNGPGDDGARTWRMGFSHSPPRLSFEDVIATIEAWSPRADAAIMHFGVPWAQMLDGRSAEDHVRGELLDLAAYYRSRGFTLVFVADPTDGLARELEAPELRERGRSIAEPEIRELYYAWLDAVVSIVQPDYLGLAAETNLIRAIATATTYESVVEMADSAATRILSRPGAPTLFVSAQVETAWGRLAGDGSYAGIAQDLEDFPYIGALGLSSYPYLGGFDVPADIPLDYYERLRADSGLPVLVVEGGWPSASAEGFASSPAEQRAYIRRQARLLDEADALAVFQLTYTDVDVASLPDAPPIIVLFATLGLVDVDYEAKPALSAWDSLYALPLAD